MIARWSAVAAVCLVLVGCSGVSQTPFQRTAGGAAGTLAAAAETLTEHREGRLTEAYARASFVSFAEALRGVREQLPSEEGAPGTAKQLGRELEEIEPLLEAPCLKSSGCDPSAQIQQLSAVSEDLLQASER
ncbi:MAG: hypothetical protein M3P18_14055 [Actinomycetota bacterium]|nr:hypothetical protein [Actinomycetota bacterium]